MAATKSSILILYGLCANMHGHKIMNIHTPVQYACND